MRYPMLFALVVSFETCTNLICLDITLILAFGWSDNCFVLPCYLHYYHIMHLFVIDILTSSVRTL
jgi:hypothetical protein